jgi:GT2 family glycosyltransferase
LSSQTCPAGQFEVLVVADSCDDDTVERATSFSAQAPYQLRVLSHSARSAAATRNLGAAQAQGGVLLFLDDDVVAQPELVQAHAETHSPDGIVLGYSKPVLPAKPSWWHYDVRRWWEDTYRAMGRPGHRFGYLDFLSGNVSMPAAMFHKAGGFDSSFAGAGLEDYELGLRLLKAGARFRFVRQAIGLHYDNTNLRQWLRRIRQEGVAHVKIGQRHPELRIPLFQHLDETGHRSRRLVSRLAFAYPHRGDLVERLLLRQAALYEQLRLRRRWRRTVMRIREYNYWRGVATASGGQKALVAWLQEAPMPPAVASNAPVVDMAVLPPAGVLQETLEQATTMGLWLHWAGVQVLSIPPKPGSEPLREEHLHAALREFAEQQFVPALALHLIRSGRGGILPC